MANINDVFPSKYLKAHELHGREPVVTIARVTLEEMGWPKETLPVVYFRNKPKGLKLNRTMAKALTAIAGSPDTNQWVGVAVQLYATTEHFNSTQHPVVRIKAPVRPAVTPPLTPRAAPPALVPKTGTADRPIDVDEDSIPF